MAEDEQQDITVDEEMRQRAEKRVKEKIALLSNLGSYLIVNTFIFLVWGFTSDWNWSNPWFVWVLIGWGIGLAFHAWNYFSGKKGEAARDRMVQKEMERIKKEGE